MNKILELIGRIKDLDGSKGMPFVKQKTKELRDDLNNLVLPMFGDKETLTFGNYVLCKWVDPKSDRVRAMIYTKESWARKQQAEFEYNQRRLDWIK